MTASFTLTNTVDAFAAEQVDDAWDPREVGNEDEISEIVRAAQEQGVITAPIGALLSFEYSADGDGGGYQWHVMLKRSQLSGSGEVVRERWLTLVSFWRGMIDISSGDDVRGVAAVREILDEAVTEGNSLLADLAWFTNRKVEILHSRNPDSDCVIRAYADGEPIELLGLEDLDPGRGYEQEDYEERLQGARAAAQASTATSFDRDLLGELENLQRSFRQWGTGHWQDAEHRL